MEIEHDPLKNLANIRERKISFNIMADFEWDSAITWEDRRKNYGELRFCALGLIGKRLHSAVFTYRENVLRIISLRKANKREQRRYKNGKEK